MKTRWCWACDQIITAQVQWLQHDGEGEKYPMHPACADQPWPLHFCEPPTSDEVIAQRHVPHIPPNRPNSGETL